MRSSWIRVGPKSSVRCQKRKAEGDLRLRPKRRPCEVGGRDWSGAPTSQGTLKRASSHWRLGERPGTVSPLDRSSCWEFGLCELKGVLGWLLPCWCSLTPLQLEWGNVTWAPPTKIHLNRLTQKQPTPESRSPRISFLAAVGVEGPGFWAAVPCHAWAAGSVPSGGGRVVGALLLGVWPLSRNFLCH